MNEDDLKAMNETPNHISGIHNYCDRWCERCPFTSRCMNYILEQKLFPDQEDRDLNNKQFWDRLAGVLDITRRMLDEMAVERGIDLESIDKEGALREREEIRRGVDEEECVTFATNYAQMVHVWFEDAREVFQEKGEELTIKKQAGPPGADPEQEVLELTDAVDVIQWYRFFIQVKLTRAKSGTLREVEDESEDIHSDSDGSAKAALIAVDRSIAAWRLLFEAFSEREDETLDVLVQLERLRRITEAAFPAARDFVRPGFDEEYP